ncbi:MAG: peptidoglycan-binding protein [Parasporobacterium sp.]|nr:peptidoglycan-binding protein [Parasporobacterium sp.]
MKTRKNVLRMTAGILAIAMVITMAGSVFAEEAEFILTEEIISDQETYDLSEEFVDEPIIAEEEVFAPAEPEVAPEDPEAVPEVVDVPENPEAEIPEDLTAPSEPAEEVLTEAFTEDPVEISEVIAEDETLAGEEGQSDNPDIQLDRDLSVGMSGDDVYAVQSILEGLGFMYYGADGYYGEYTKIAVQLFQAESGFPTQDGEVGYWTMYALRENPFYFYNLSYGMDNPAVALMQQYLIEQGYLDSYADGYFGDWTLDAVKRFQMANGFGNSGIADMRMLTVLIAGIGSTFRELKKGDVGSDVASIQSILTSAGFLYSIIDGDFGAYTEQAVCLFQAYNGTAAPNGRIDAAAYYALMNGTYQPFYALNPGDSGNAVFSMQRCLKELGFLLTEPNGVFDEATEEALIAMQTLNSLSATGIADYSTMNLLISMNAVGKDSITISLRLGDSNEDVLRMQQKLYELGYLGIEPDGYFGNWTYTAVCAFQAAQNCYYPDGVVTPGFYTMIMRCNTPFVPVTYGCSSTEIYHLQLKFESYGMLAGADGDFGSMTETAIRQIQKMFGLPQTGAADAATIFYIYNYSSYLDNYYDVQSYYSNTGWLIFINTTTNRMYVYKGSTWNWELVYNWPCSTGAPGTPTVLGQYTTSFSGYSFGDGYSYTCYYFTSFFGPYYMHSTLYQAYSWNVNDSRVGVNLSHGCVRLETENAKWVYYNIPYGTKVVTVQ